MQTVHVRLIASNGRLVNSTPLFSTYAYLMVGDVRVLPSLEQAAVVPEDGSVVETVTHGNHCGFSISLIIYLLMTASFCHVMAYRSLPFLVS